MADLNIAPRSVVDWVEALRPLHAFQAAELILAGLSEANGEEVLFPGVTINRRAKLLGYALHAWAALMHEQMDRGSGELRKTAGRRLAS